MLINLRCLTYLQSSSKYSNLEGLLLEKEDGVSKNATHTHKKNLLGNCKSSISYDTKTNFSKIFPI